MPRRVDALTPFGTCPVPQSQYDHILLGHGSGGQLTADLIQRLFVPAFGNDVLAALEDQATVSLGCGQRREGAAARLHDRLVRGPAALLSRAATSAGWRSTAR